MDREPEKLPTEFDDKTTSLFSEFMLRVAKFEELVDIARQFLTGFCQELVALVSNLARDLGGCQVDGCNILACLISVCDGVTLVPIQVHSCMQVLQDHLMKVKVLLNELECLKEDAIGIAQKVSHSTTCDDEGLSLEEEDIEESRHLQEKSTSYATLMAVIYNMLMLDYTMQENIINSINWTAAKPEHLESYCLMWNLRPYINDSVMRQGWKLVS